MEERTYDERVMEKAGELLADERLRAFGEMNGEAHIFSGRFEVKKEKLFRREAGTGSRGRITGRRALRILAVCAAAVILMTVSVMAVPPVRSMILEVSTRLVSGWSGDNILRLEVETDNIPGTEPTGEPAYIPEGYKLAEVHNLPEGAEDGHVSMVWIAYMNTDGPYTPIVLRRIPCVKRADPYPGEGEYAGIGYYFGGDRMGTETVQIGPYEGMLIRQPITEETTRNDLFGTMLVWSDSYYYYDLAAVTEEVPGDDLIPLPYEELLRMAESFCP